MKILVIGSGGREHALAWKIAQSPMLDKLYIAPGNPGTRSLGENVAIDSSDIPALVEFAVKENIDLTVVGPELPLVLGITDEFEKKNLKIFGPRKNAAQLEGSKVFAKEFMERHKIPTGRFRIAYSPVQAHGIIDSGELGFPVVIKADGLAAGKGVLICRDKETAHKAVETIMVEKKFGESGNRILVEEFLSGKEASFIVVADGIQVLPFVTTMDHKALLEGDEGPNTGGMGAISPSPFIDKDLFDGIMESIVFPTIMRMHEEGRKYKGVLYVGLKLTDKGPKVLEYNCRFGDPETQAILPLLSSSLLDPIATIAEGGSVAETELQWHAGGAVTTVLASEGYPGGYEKGKAIEFPPTVAEDPDLFFFHAGTRKSTGGLVTNGGRVLAVTGLGDSLGEASRRSLVGADAVHFDGKYFRTDIGWREFARDEGKRP